jgi:hypothetical protein
MTAMLSLLALAVLVALGIWLFGGALLRTGGALLAVGWLVGTAATGSFAMAALGLAGVLAWFAGHWLFAVRHHYFRSPLARRLFNDALPVLNPTRRWGVPNVPPERRR